DLAFVQATGRDHEHWRASVTAATPEEAAEALERLASGAAPVSHAPDATALVTLLSHEGATEPGAASAWTGAFPALADWRAERTAGVAAAERDAAERLVDRLIPVRALFEAGVPDRIVIGHG